MANTEKVTIQIASVGTQQVAKDTKSLKQQIRDLKLELEQLTPETEEYNEKIRQMGELMHRQSELTEQAKLANDDLGQSYSNLSAMAQGIVGSFAAVQGIMNAVGVSTSGTEEAIKQMTSLLAILQGLSSLDKAEKAFNGLNLKIDAFVKKLKLGTKELANNTAAQKTNANAAKEDAASMGAATKATKAQGDAAAAATVKTNLLSFGFKKLGLAIKSFMASNPFTLILLGITAATTALSSFIEKQKESKRKMEEMTKANADYMASRVTDYDVSNYTYEQSGRKVYKEKNPRTGMVDPSIKELQDLFDATVDKYNKALKEMEEADEKYTEAYKDKMKERLDYVTKESSYRITFLENKIKNEKDGQEKYGEELKNFYVSLGKAEEDYLKYVNEYNKNVLKQQEETNKQKLENYKNYQTEREKLANEALEKIQKEYQVQKNQADRDYANGIWTTDRYYKKLILEQKKYQAAFNKWVEDWGKSGYDVALKQQEIMQIIAETGLKFAEFQHNLNYSNPPSNAAEERLQKEALIDIRREAELRRQSNAAMLNEAEEYLDKTLDIYNAWWLKKYTLIDRYNRKEIEEEREKNGLILELDYNLLADEQNILTERYEQSKTDEVSQYDYDLASYRDMLDKKLITQEEYNQKTEELARQHRMKMDAIEGDYIQNFADLEDAKSQKMLEIQENRYQMELEYFNRRMELEKAYIDAFGSIYGQITTLLGEVQNGYEEGTKQYEQIAETMLIMQTIESAMAGFKSGVEAPIPAPGNFVLGGILAALATATGIASISNLKNKKLSSAVGNASININPYETLSTQTNAELLGQIADSRCYVLEQDITSTVNRVSVTEQEASF